MKNSSLKTFLDLVTYSLLILGAVIMITPFIWMVATSFKLQPTNLQKHLFLIRPQ